MKQEGLVVTVSPPATPSRKGRRLRWLLLPIALVGVAYLGLNFLRFAMPARMVGGLIDTTWQIESLDRDRLDDLAVTLTFAEGDVAEFGDAGSSLAFLDSACGRRTFGWDLDTDGSDIGFWLLATNALACNTAAAATELTLVETLPMTSHWVVESDDVIEIKGEAVLRLVRSDNPLPLGSNAAGARLMNAQDRPRVTFADAD